MAKKPNRTPTAPLAISTAHHRLAENLMGVGKYGTIKNTVETAIEELAKTKGLTLDGGKSKTKR